QRPGDAGERGFAWYWRGHSSLPSDSDKHAPEPGFCFPLQQYRCPCRRGRAVPPHRITAVTHDCRARHEPQFRFSGEQCIAASSPKIIVSILAASRLLSPFRKGYRDRGITTEVTLRR